MRTTLSLLALAAGVSAATISIDVGEGGSLKFDPDSVTAAVGDTLEFHFYSGSGGHSVVSSSFSSPCQPETNSFFSGYVTGDGTGDMTFVTTVNSTDPIWFYCSLGFHCQSGMVGVVNPPSGQTVSDYAAAAQKVTEASAPASPQGGVVTSIAPGSPSSSSMIGNASSTMSSATMSGSLTGMATDTGLRSSTSSSAGGSATSLTGMATNTGSRAPTTGGSMSASASPTTKASAGVGKKEGSDTAALMGLAIFACGLVVLMA